MPVKEGRVTEQDVILYAGNYIYREGMRLKITEEEDRKREWEREGGGKRVEKRNKRQDEDKGRKREEKERHET